MESFYHGKSSGIDPLICYLKLPLLISSLNEISIIKVPDFKPGKGAIFLINSGIPKKTSNMIKIFFNKLKKENFKKILKEEFIKYSNKCIKYFLNKDFEKLLKNVKILSTWIYKNLNPMIPSSLWEIWEKGILTNDYYLKLCGSGGGGFILGFTYDYELVKKKLKNYNPQILFELNF